jgi:malonate transporter and related proteins
MANRAKPAGVDLIARIAPFFGLIALGAVGGRLGLINVRVGQILAGYTFWIGFPGLLIRWLGDAPPPDPTLARLLAAYAVAMIAALVAGPLGAALLGWPRETRAGLAMTSAVGNTAFLGAPVAVAVLGEGARAPAAALVAVDFIVLMALAIAVLQAGRPGGSLLRALGKVLLNPTVAGAVIGLSMSSFALRLPGPADQALTWVALTASPVALLALGGLIGREHETPRRDEVAPLVLTLALKLLLAPALVWLALGLAGAEPVLRATATLLAACPTAVNVFIQTRAQGVFVRGAVQAIVAGTVVSAATLTLIAHALTG